MKKNTILFLSLLAAVFISTRQAQARTLVEDNGTDYHRQFRASRNSRSAERDDTDGGGDGDENRTTYYKEAETGPEMRKIRRMAIGLQAAGALGLGGAIMDLNFTPQWSATAGYGGGSGFQSFEVQAKYVFAGDWIMPYLGFGYSRWSSTGQNGPLQNTNPPLLGQRLLSDAERASGQFQENILYPALGIQYIQLSGPWAGSSVYAELTALFDLNNFVGAPTGAFGVLYYF